MLYTYENFFVCICLVFYQYFSLQIVLYVYVKSFENVSSFYGSLSYFHHECVSNCSEHRIAIIFVKRVVDVIHKCLNNTNAIAFIIFTYIDSHLCNTVIFVSICSPKELLYMSH